MIDVAHVEPRALAASWATATGRGPFGPLIIELLNGVWPVLRAQNVATGHNVVLYMVGPPLRIAAGVEVPSGFEPTNAVQRVSTPSGETAHAVHWGDYAGLRDANQALEAWCRANDRSPAGTSWEVYGDWHDDPAQVRTDVHVLLAR